MKIKQFKITDDFPSTPFNIQFSRPVTPDHNFFSILIGANGTRKSRTLRDILDIASRMIARESMEHKNKAGQLELWGNARNTRSIRKIIALSGVATDRFPSRLTLHRKSSLPDLYSYIGPRTDNNLVSRVQSINRVALGLLQASSSIRQRSRALAALLKVLGSFDYIEFTFKVHDDLQGGLSELQIQNRLRKINMGHRGFYWDEQRTRPLLPKIVEIVGNRSPAKLRVDVHPAVTIKTNGDIDALELLASSGLLTVDSGNIGNSSKGVSHSLSELSSGQWHMLSSLLFTAASVEDDTLMLVDEPENSLHPAWQQQYLGLLSEMIDGVKGVHVMVATHSPLIAASLPPLRCEVIQIRESRARLVARALPSGPFGWTADQILKDVFNLSSTRSLDFSKEMDIALRHFGAGDRDNPKLVTAVNSLVTLKAGLPEDDLARSVIDTLSSVVLRGSSSGRGG